MFAGVGADGTHVFSRGASLGAIGTSWERNEMGGKLTVGIKQLKEHMRQDAVPLDVPPDVSVS